ncbi:MAG: serine/threonine-protein phosphatase [Methylococcaceae bacterium]|nr:MAG: serine/threonine-protein phosphatase [Methylococcaceae bacterium]
MQQAIEKANQAIHDTAARSPAYEGMGTTIVVATFNGGRFNVGHVGDSRLYRLRDGNLEQLTTDHSLSHELIAKGYFQNVEEVAAAGLKNAITRALGLDTAVQVDLMENAVQADDIYLLCSDGLTDMVPDPQIQSILADHGADLKPAVDKLIEVAKQNGGRDNISVILVRPLAVKTRPAITTWPRRLIRWFGNFFATGE